MAYDYMHQLTDDELRKLEQRIHDTYETATREMQDKLQSYLDQYAEKLPEMQKKLADGKISQRQYDAWSREAIMHKEWYEDMTDALATDMVEVDGIATSMTKEFCYDAYANNFNYGIFEAELGSGEDISFTLYDRDTVERLVRDDPDLLPFAGDLDKKKDLRWNKGIFNSGITQGILQGESIPDIAKRVALGTAQRDMHAAIRNARTATTGAENAGRVNSYERAVSMGIQMEQIWLATLDGRTRHEHRQLDGQKVKVGEKFHVDGYEIAFPGDPTAKPFLVWNCRCTLIGKVAGSDIDPLNMSQRNIDKMGMEYEEWKNAKAKTNDTPEHTVVDGKDISGTWTRRKDKFDFEIDDVINAQGFDGLPRVVSAKDFDKAVQESGLYAQRVYSSTDEEILKQYRDELYNGKFYVDCSVGGSDFGQGMYMSGDFTGKQMQDIIADSESYVKISENRGNKYSYIEKMTLDKESKIATYDDLLKQYQNESIELQRKITNNTGHQLVEDAVNKHNLNKEDKNYLLWGLNISKDVEPFNIDTAMKYSGDKASINSIRKGIENEIKLAKAKNPIIGADGDMGIYGTLKGYDAINIEKQATNGTSQVLVLNRTKLIIQQGV